MYVLSELVFVILVLGIASSEVGLEKSRNYYDRFTGEKLDEEKYRQFKSQGILSNCSILIKPCAAHEGSRVDGTCNNYKYPTRGSALGPYLRLLKPDYPQDHGIRKDKNGKPLPSARKVRTALQSTGVVVDKHVFNVAAYQFAEVAAVDVSAVNGILDFIRDRPYCCDEEGEDDPRCIPIEVPKDDILYRLGHIDCLNFSRAHTFQDSDCIADNVTPEQVNTQTPLLDLSHVYGVNEESLAKVREGRDGLLKMEIRNSRYVPLGNAGRDVCFENRPNETICYQFGFPAIGNFDLRLAQFLIFFMREHNRIAVKLKELNPCWKDDRLFKVARQINIATLQNIYMYELLPIIMGRTNMINYGLIADRVGHVKGYDENSVPLLYAEYVIATRFFHTLIDGRIKMYKENYHYSGSLSMSDTLFRLALIEENKNFEEINRGTFYQNAAKIDDIQDPEISEKFFGELQKASDLPALDIQRGRDMGVRGYNSYRHLCGMKPAKKFEDFADVIDYEKIHILEDLYEDIEDVDLLAGIVSERFVEGSYVGPTLFCIMTKQILLWRHADRFWFERGDNHHSFTLQQLHEIRKTNMARFACDNAEGIKYIQPRALLNVAQGNEPVPCTHIQGADLSEWKDDSCPRHKDHQQSTFNPFSSSNYYYNS